MSATIRLTTVAMLLLVLTSAARAQTPSAMLPLSGLAEEPGLMESPFELSEDAGEEPHVPEHIRDNAFLVEEAFNQEPGEVQHVFNWVQLWDRTPGGRTRDFAMAYTMELPLWSQKHQFSFTMQALDFYEREVGQPPVHQGGMGDTFLSYRYQLLDNDDFLWCAPRFTLIAPTGDERFGLGAGSLGYQFNLPISHYGDRFDFHFNAGATHIPNAVTPLFVNPLFDEQNLNGYNLGASVFWKPKVNLNFFVEGLALWIDELDGVGAKATATQVFINPGARYAVCQFEQVEWVLGASVPVGLTGESPDIGAFFYMSVEHIFLKVE